MEKIIAFYSLNCTPEIKKQITSVFSFAVDSKQMVSLLLNLDFAILNTKSKCELILLCLRGHTKDLGLSHEELTLSFA